MPEFPESLGDVSRNAARHVAGEQIGGRRAGKGSSSKIHIGEGLTVAVADDEADQGGGKRRDALTCAAPIASRPNPLPPRASPRAPSGS
jgi:hypothetical protein